jgi:phosphate-selective porin OprO/OprP
MLMSRRHDVKFLAGCVLSAAALLITSQPATAQSASQPPAGPRVVTGQDGFAIESADGDFRLQFGLFVHADGRFALDDSGDQVVDTFAIRRARPYLRGRLSRRFEFYFNPDFAGGTLTVQDAYVDTVFAPAFRLRAGKAKAPFGMERLYSASSMLFFERGFPTSLVPNRDVGVQALGDLSGGIVTYMAGVMNGVADGGSGDVDSNDGKDIVARVVLRPFRRSAESPVARLNLGFSASTGTATALPTFRTPSLQQTYFTYAGGATPALPDGRRTRISPQLWYFSGPFAGWVEYVRTETPIRRGSAAADVGHRAWQVAGSWVLTGESATESGTIVRPSAAFDFGSANWGALQVAARYHALEVDDEAFTLGLAAAGASRKAEAWTLGLRWYATSHIWYTVNVERTVFDDAADGPRKAENALAFRTQLNF